VARVYCGRCNGSVFQHKMGAGERQADASSLWLKGAQLSDSIIMCWQPNATRYMYILGLLVTVMADKFLCPLYDSNWLCLWPETIWVK